MAIDEVTSYVHGISFEQFIGSSLVFNATLRQLAVIGEASSRISDGLKKNYPQIPRRQIIGMRNIIIHDYFGVSYQFVWSTINQDLPELKTEIETILKNLA